MYADDQLMYGMRTTRLRRKLPMVILEAMAAGKPIVATEIGGVAEAVKNDRTGILVPVGDVQAFAGAARPPGRRR